MPSSSFPIVDVVSDSGQIPALNAQNSRAANFSRRFGDVVEVGWGGVRAPHWRGDWPINALVQLFVRGADGPTCKTTTSPGHCLLCSSMISYLLLGLL